VFYQADGLGSITSLSSSTGTVSDSFVYDSFGNMTSAAGTFAQPFRYTAREYDDELGRITNNTYDANSNLTATTAHLDANTPVQTSYTYNSMGEPLTVTCL